MKDEHLFFNPFRMLSPTLDREALRIEDLYEKPVSDSITLEEGVLTMTSKLAEMCRLLSKCIVSGSVSQMDRCEALAGEVHEQEEHLTRNLVGSKVEQKLLKGMIRFPYRLERIGDMLESILNCCRIKAAKGIPFSDKAHGELNQLFTQLLAMLQNFRDAIRAPNKVILDAIIADGKKLNEMFEECRIAHWQRLEAGFCAIEASSMYRDILDSVKTINEYLIKMSTTLLDLGLDASAKEEMERAS
jgi:Na+/phosphate symporter